MMTDVTWDDREESGIAYTNYNMGTSQAASRYAWLPQALNRPVVEMAGNDLRNEELSRTEVTSWEEVYDALRAGAAEKKTRIGLQYSSGFKVGDDSSRLNNLIYSVGVSDYFWNLKDDTAEVYGIEYYDASFFCDTEEEVLSTVEACAKERKANFRLYFSPELSARLFADEMKRLYFVLAQTRLVKPWTYNYNADIGRLVFSEAEYWGEDETAGLVVTDTWDEVYAQLRAFTAQRKKRLILYSETLDLYENSDELNRLIYSSGVKEYTWSFYQGFVSVMPTQYYENAAFCASEDEVLKHLQNCRAAGVKTLAVYCTTDSLYNSLHENSSSRFFDLIGQVGCSQYQLYHSDSVRRFYLEVESW